MTSAGHQKSIGGYLELEIPVGSGYHNNLIMLNTGRNALEYILKQRRYRKIYLPYFTCDVLLEPIKKLGVEYSFYTIDERLEPVEDFSLSDDECLLYTNYFGIKQRATETLAYRYKNIIIDNAQAFFAIPLAGVDTFYSCRKFFGVPDGAYLQISRKMNRKFPLDDSTSRFNHLIKSIDQSIEAAYPDYIQSNKQLEHNNIRLMSLLTRKLLAGIDYEKCARIRRRNFDYLHKHLGIYNMLRIQIRDDEIPMVYPFYTDNRKLRLDLIQQKIYVATYWPNVFDWTTPDMIENQLSRGIIPLPIDQRYNLYDMLFIINKIKELI